MLGVSAMRTQRFDCLGRRVAEAGWIASIDPIHCQFECIAQSMCMAYRDNSLATLILIVRRRINACLLRELRLLQPPHPAGQG